MTILNRHNLKAFCIHGCISAAIAAASLVLVYCAWYPAPLATALGVSNIFLMLLAIDLILGPLLTLVVYKPSKASLKFDLAVIACVQAAALVYGLHTVGSARPAYVVFTKDRFDLVQAHEVAQIMGEGKHVQLALESPWAQPWYGYSLASAKVPSPTGNEHLLNILVRSAMNGGPDVPNVTQLRGDYAFALSAIQTTALPLATLKSAKPELGDKVKAWQSQYPAGSAVLPLKIKFTIYTVVLNPQNGQVLGIEPVDVF
jgi:hypothetical protein